MGRFQSTLPAGGATNTGAYSLTGNQDFNPRSPRGERPEKPCPDDPEEVFQSTLPAGGATQVRYHKVE